MNGIYVNRGRFDAGSYSKEIIETIAVYCQKFYIRANCCDTLTGKILQTENWETVTVNYVDYQVCGIPFIAFFEEKNYRLVVRTTGNPTFSKAKNSNTVAFSQTILSVPIRKLSNTTINEVREKKTSTFKITISVGNICRLPK
jgi:hypothetical protein